MATHEDGVYKRKNREGYFLQWTDAGGKRRTAKSIHKYLEAARKERDLYIQGQHEKQLVARNREKEISFADAAQKFLAYQKPRLKNPKSYVREEGIIGHLKAFFTGCLVEITPAQVSDYLTARLGEVSKSSVRKELVSLQHLLRLAYDVWEFLPETHPNPTRKLKAKDDLKGHDVERAQYLELDQFRRLLAASPENMKPIFALLTATGMRRGELLACRWRFVDKTRILLPTSKNNDPKEIQLNVLAQRVLASLPPGEPDDLLFPHVTTPEQVSMAFHRVCEILSISDIRLHDLRHTFATWLRQRGTELDVIASQLGHRDLRMTKRYARVAAAQVRKAVIGLDADFATITESPVTEVMMLAGKSPVREAIFPPTRSPSAAETLPANSLKILSALE